MLKLLTRADVPGVAKYLDKYPLETTFLRSNLLACGIENRFEEGRSGDYFGYYNARELTGVIGFSNMGSCVPHFMEEAAAIEFAAAMTKRQFKILLGFSKFIFPLCRLLEDRKPVREATEGLYLINDTFMSFSAGGISLKKVSELDENIAADFVVKAYRDGYSDEKSRQEVLRMFREHTGEEEFLFLLVDGRIMAQGYVQASTGKVGQIGGVYTIEEARGQGYCKTITSELCRRIIGSGKLPALIVRKDNFPAIQAYERIGFHYFDDYMMIKF